MVTFFRFVQLALNHPTGFTVTVALPDLVGSATLVAVTVTVCEVVTVDGAVYSPAVLRVPTAGLNDQFTAVFVVPVTVAVNCCVCEAVRSAVAGETETEITPENSAVMLMLSKEQYSGLPSY